MIFHRKTLLEAFDAVGEALYDYKVCGDWRLYAEICVRETSRVSYCPEALNAHRRHRISVTHALNVEKHLKEIATMQSWVKDRSNLPEQVLALQEEHLESCRAYLTRDLGT